MCLVISGEFLMVMLSNICSYPLPKIYFFESLIKYILDIILLSSMYIIVSFIFSNSLTLYCILTVPLDLIVYQYCIQLCLIQFLTNPLSLTCLFLFFIILLIILLK